MVKKLLISTFCVGSLCLASAQQAVPLSQVSAKSVATEQTKDTGKKLEVAKVLKTKKIAKGVTQQVVQDPEGRIYKRLITSRNQSISKLQYKSAGSATSSDVALKESFEETDGSETWQPEGWTTESKGEAFTSEFPENWYVTYPATGYEPDAIGNYYEYIPYNENNSKDEWLVTPQVTLTEFPKLYYYAYVNPVYLFNIGSEYVDWDKYEFLKKECAANVQVLLKAEGDADWTVLKDYYEEYKDMSLSEVIAEMPSSLVKFTIDLAAYAGKKVQVAFRYNGLDGNSVYLDAVSLSNPELEVSYSYPSGTMFFGVSKDLNMLLLSMPLLPVNQELVWENQGVEDSESAVSYQWSYSDPNTTGETTANTKNLSVTYHPDYYDESTVRNNLYKSPVLTASAPGAAPGEYSRYNYFQAGGKAEFELEEGYKTFGATVFDPNEEGIDIFVVDNDMEVGTPIFGYNANVDKFWTDYTFDGDEGDGVKMTGILNYIAPTEKPIVFSEAWVHGKGQIAANAEFTLDVILLTDEGTLGEIYATTTVKGSDCIIKSSEGTQDFITVPFKFEAPVVMSQEVCQAYIVRFSGFNDAANVTYFAPFMSVEDNPDGLAYGWIEKQITMNGETVSSLTPVVNYTEGLQSFAIVLDAVYPWLDAEKNDVSISSEGVQEVKLGSYYDGSELTATQEDGTALPEWLKVSCTGQYGEAKAVFTAGGDKAGSSKVKISAPGVSQVFSVSYDGSASVELVSADENDGDAQMFNLTGQKVTGKPAAGLYIVRKANGKVYKQIVK